MDQTEKYIKANTGVIVVRTYEEQRFLEHVDEIAKRLELPVYLKLTSGWVNRDRSEIQNNTGQIKLFDLNLPKVDKQGIWIYLHDQPTTRWLREFTLYSRKGTQIVMIVGPEVSLPTELLKDGVLIDFKLPTVEQLVDCIDKKVDRETAKQLATEARGMTTLELKRAMSLDSNKTGWLNQIREEKKRTVQSSGLLEIVSPGDMKDIGGLDLLKSWLRVRRKALEPSARQAGLPTPKGVMAVGLPGTGKSEIAKAVAGEWGWPLIRMDPSRLYAQYVGNTETNVRSALRLLEAASPCVLWIDEIEKGLAGGSANADSDNGVTHRMIGTLLTWMQERDGSVFVVATANAVDRLPPELLRKGRFDEIFFVDLPTHFDRESIFEVVLRRYDLDPSGFDVSVLSDLSKGFSGAEIEEAIRSSLYECYVSGLKLTTATVATSIRNTTPLSATAKERIEQLRKWSVGRARPASLGEMLTVSAGQA